MQSWVAILLAIKTRRERWGKERRSWRWPVSVEKVQSCSRLGGTNMAAILMVEVEGESRTETRRSGVWTKGDGRGLGKVKVM